MTNNVITMDVINAIIAKAINKRFSITSYTSDYTSEINIYNNEDKCIFHFQITITDDKETTFGFYSDNGSIDNVKIESESFILKFKLLIEDCINYSRTMALKDIETFLAEEKKEDVILKDINDLDNEDD